jgi:hypothetical protein
MLWIYYTKYDEECLTFLDFTFKLAHFVMHIKLYLILISILLFAMRS